MISAHPVIIHVPHASRLIPIECRESLLLDERALELELLKLTDAYTNLIFPPNLYHVVEAPVSRLVVDVERFRDDKSEDMTRVGMGAVYECGYAGAWIRFSDPEVREQLLRSYYDPHHEALAFITKNLLSRHGRVLIIDLHSFPRKPLPYESNQEALRPEVCLGTDPFHTPRTLYKACRTFLEGRGFVVEENTPFSGTMVPISFYQVERNVESIMVEMRRDLIMDEDSGELLATASHLFDSVREMVVAVSKA